MRSRYNLAITCSNFKLHSLGVAIVTGEFRVCLEGKISVYLLAARLEVSQVFLFESICHLLRPNSIYSTGSSWDIPTARLKMSKFHSPLEASGNLLLTLQAWLEQTPATGQHIQANGNLFAPHYISLHRLLVIFSEAGREVGVKVLPQYRSIIWKEEKAPFMYLCEARGRGYEESATHRKL
jgi:hypothetical protein